MVLECNRTGGTGVEFHSLLTSTTSILD